MSATEIQEIREFIVEELKKGTEETRIKWLVYEKYPSFFDLDSLVQLIRQFKNAKQLRN